MASYDACVAQRRSTRDKFMLLWYREQGIQHRNLIYNKNSPAVQKPSLCRDFWGLRRFQAV